MDPLFQTVELFSIFTLNNFIFITSQRQQNTALNSQLWFCSAAIALAKHLSDLSSSIPLARRRLPPPLAHCHGVTASVFPTDTMSTFDSPDARTVP